LQEEEEEKQTMVSMGLPSAEIFFNVPCWFTPKPVHVHALNMVP
jgi:hypothetical protein